MGAVSGVRVTPVSGTSGVEGGGEVLFARVMPGRGFDAFYAWWWGRVAAMVVGLEESLRLSVAALMQATGQSQRVVAGVLGLTQAQVSRRQSGASSWTLRDVDVLAGFYGIDVLDLLAGPTRACEALMARQDPRAGTGEGAAR